MKCFQVVQNVLTSTFGQIQGSQEEKVSLVKACLRTISQKYRNALLTEGGPDFADPITRFAYVFLYVPVNAHWLYELIGWSPDVQELFDKPKLRATCLGGGPGSDLVGILKYMDENGRQPALFCEIVDGCVDWKSTWSDLAFEIAWSSPVNTDYVIHHAGKNETWTSPWNIAKSDLITLNFFWSELVHLGAVAVEYLYFALNAAKPGALLLYNDNGHSWFSDPFDEISKESGFQTILTGAGDRRVYDYGEQIADFGEFANMFDYNPRLTGQLAWRVLRKN
jgi:hypothetical protein